MAVARQYTTSAPPETVTGSRSRLVLAEGGVASRPSVPLSVILLGIVTVIVGAWGAAAPFCGPDFGFVADRYTAWQWSQTSLFLALIPGAVALICGLWVLAAATRPSYGRRPDLWLLGLVVAASGAWFVAGQYVWRAIGNRAFIAPSGATHFMWKEMCFAVGPGVILVLCGALFMGWAVRRQLAVVAEHYSRVDTVAPAAPVAEPVQPVATTSTMAPPPVQQPMVEQPVQPVVQQPVSQVQQPVVQQPVQPVVQEPATQVQQPVVHQPVQPVVQQPVQPVVQEPATQAQQPIAGEPGVVTRPAHAPSQPVIVERPATGPTGEPLA